MIEKIRLRNFRRYRDTTLRFEGGVNLIEGRNNVGKTTIFFAIEYALFGRVENFKTIRSLMQPGKRSIGVEIVFTGRNGDRYLLQRIHQTPSKTKKTLEGHFTLKQILDDGERYLLASDFGDTEDKLAISIGELTGLTRRLFSIALHMRQGEIPSILEGSRQLDIVLGVTAAAMAEEELRQMAIELEKESAGLPVLQERLRSVGAELGKLAEEIANLDKDRAATESKLKALGEASDPRGELDRKLAPLNEKLATFEAARQRAELARQRLADESARQAEAMKMGAREDIDKELAKLAESAAARGTTLAKLRGELEDAGTEQRKLDAQRGDLAGRIDRRKSLPKGKGAKCEMCGAPIKAAETAKELAEWTAELEKLDTGIAATAERIQKLRKSIDDESAAERKHLERVAELTRQRGILTELESSLAGRRQQLGETSAAETAAHAAIQAEARGVAPKLQTAGYDVRWNLESEPAGLVASVRQGIESLRQALAERVGRLIAERQAMTELLERFEAQSQSLDRRQSELEREQAAAQAEAGALQVKATRAQRFRAICVAFKELQVQIRSDAATRLAANTLELHRRLADGDEFQSLTIDPAKYSVQVTPRDLGEEVPAGLYEGGGHRLLLGLAYRLAVAGLADHCPFLMLDEPTDGLDAVNREALLARIGKHDLARQILLVTHEARDAVPGHRVKVARRDKETVVEE
jgi:exonuclease SbcC